MAPKPKAQLMRESRMRKRDNILRSSEEFMQFLRDTPFASCTTEIEKFQEFLQFRTLKNASTPKSAAQRKRESRKRQKDDNSKREANKLRMRRVRFKKKLAMEELKRKTAEEEIRVDSISEPPNKVFIDERVNANYRLNQSRNGVCDQLSFECDMKHVPSKMIDLMHESYPNINPYQVCVYKNSYQSLLYINMPHQDIFMF